MSNTYPTPCPWPNPDDAAPGARWKVAQQLALAESSNYLHSDYHAQTVFQQGWALGARWNSSYVDVARWRIPPLTGHSSLELAIWARSTTTPGAVRFTSANTGATRTFTPAVAGSSSRYSGNLNVGTLGSTGDVITMALQGTGGEVRVDDVHGYYPFISPPIPTGASGGFRPQGASRAGADLPLSSRRGRQLLANARDLRARPRSFFAVSGLSNITSYAPDASDVLAPYQQVTCVPVWPGALRQGVTYALHVYARGIASYTSRVRLVAGAWGQLEQDFGAYLEWSAGAAASWKSTTFTLPEDLDLGLLERPGCFVGLLPATDGFGIAAGGPRSPGRSSAEILSCAMWGAV